MLITFNPKTNRYRAANGRFITAANVRKGVEKSIEVVRQDMKRFGKQLATGKINLPEFQTRMAGALKTAHSVSAAIGRGGRAQMTLSDWATVGNTLKKQYGYLNRFALGVENGTITPAQIETRAAAYAISVREPFYKQVMKAEKRAGKTKCRRVLHASESCSECASWAGRGFVGIDEQPGIGNLICGNHCRCSLEFE